MATNSNLARSVYVFLLCLLLRSSLSGSFTSEDVLVKDNLFTTNEIWEMKTLLSQDETLWSFQPNEPNNISSDSQTEAFSAQSCYSWSANLTSPTFTRSSSWRKVSDTLSSHFRSKGDWSILAIEGQINIKASHTCTCSKWEFNGNNVNSYIAVIFLVQNWRRNGYGELVVYEDGEILKAVYPKNGRLVILPASLEHVIKPPAIDMTERLYVIKIHIMQSDEKRHSEIKELHVSPDTTSTRGTFSFEHYPSFKFLTKTGTTPSEKLDIKQFITRNFTTSDGRCVIVLDNIVPARELDALRQTVVSSGYNDNAAGMDSTDSVQWIMAFEVDDFVQTSLWQLISQIVTAVSGREGYYPYDIGCNNIQSVDTTTIHTDCADYENEFTLLIYLNQNWTENHHGETVFFSDMEGNEVIFAVRPKYGRVAIFHGTIPHSARPPPLTYEGARFSFAVKMSPSKEIALRKSNMMEIDVLEEALETLQGDEAEKLKNTIHKIKEGKMDRETVFKVVDEYESRLEEMRKQLKML
ncbi:hypothetical protein ACROYT_G003194 [Oculina patagonica]